MQDKTYVIAIIVVLAICCLGMYVAVSGYLNSNPGAFPDIVGSFQGTPVVVSISTYTPAATQAVVALPNTPTIAAVPSPLGALQTITAAATIVIPTPVPTRAVVASPAATGAPGFPSCAGFAFCPRVGPPSYELGIGGNPCKNDYIWGRVTDANGRGLREWKIRYQNPFGEVNTVTTKGAPDPEGVYNIPSVAIGSKWTIWLLDAAGREVSPRVIFVVQAYTGVGDCPTRIDFVQQR
ncbi:MAG: hypothetical protein AB1817_12300 [Chloroflexota bacterium]